MLSLLVGGGGGGAIYYIFGSHVRRVKFPPPPTHTHGRSPPFYARRGGVSSSLSLLVWHLRI